MPTTPTIHCLTSQTKFINHFLQNSQVHTKFDQNSPKYDENYWIHLKFENVYTKMQAYFPQNQPNNLQLTYRIC